MTTWGGAGPARRTAALLFAALFPAGAAWLYFVAFDRGPTLWLLYPACKLVQFSFPLLWSRLDRPPARPVPRGRRAAAGLISGAAAGLLILGAHAVLRGGELAGHAGVRIAARLQALEVATPARYLLLAAFLSLVHSLLEEYYWRWFVHGMLRERLPVPAAAMLSSLAFMAHHVVVVGAFLGTGGLAWAVAAGSLAVAAAGLLWAWLYERSGSLVAPWLSHLLVDVAILGAGLDLVWDLL